MEPPKDTVLMYDLLDEPAPASAVRQVASIGLLDLYGQVELY